MHGLRQVTVLILQRIKSCLSGILVIEIVSNLLENQTLGRF